MKKIITQLTAGLLFAFFINTAQADAPLKCQLKKGAQFVAARAIAWILGEKAPFPQTHYDIHNLIISTTNGEIMAKGTLDLISNQPDLTSFKLAFSPLALNKGEVSKKINGKILFSKNQSSCLIVGKIKHDSPTTAHLILNKEKSTCPILVQYQVEVCDSLTLTAMEPIPMIVKFN